MYIISTTVTFTFGWEMIKKLNKHQMIELWKAPLDRETMSQYILMYKDKYIKFQNICYIQYFKVKEYHTKVIILNLYNSLARSIGGNVVKQRFLMIQL